MLKSSLQFSSRMTKEHQSSMFLGLRDQFVVFNLTFGLSQLNRVCKFLQFVKQQEGNVWWLGTDQVIGDFLNTQAKCCSINNQIIITRSWIPGLLTNFETFQQISKRIVQSNQIKFDDLSVEDWALTTSFWKSLDVSFFQQRKKGDRFKSFLSLILQQKGQWQLPDLIIRLNPEDHRVAFLEAQRLNIPIIVLRTKALDNSNSFSLPISHVDLFWIFQKM